MQLECSGWLALGNRNGATRCDQGRLNQMDSHLRPAGCYIADPGDAVGFNPDPRFANTGAVYGGTALSQTEDVFEDGFPHRFPICKRDPESPPPPQPAAPSCAEGLLAFRAEWADPDGMGHNIPIGRWDPNIPTCEWDKVQCLDPQNPTAVTKINLGCASRFGITGDIRHLAACTELTWLSLRTTGATGDIGSLAALTKLQHASFYRASIYGDIAPLYALTDLTYLQCHSTSVTGPTEPLTAHCNEAQMPAQCGGCCEC